MEAGARVATTNYRIATRLPRVEVVVDATGQAEMGAVVCLDAFDQKKHVVMMNVECDVTIGPILRRLADNAGVVYSWAAGRRAGRYPRAVPVRQRARLRDRRGRQGQEQPAAPRRHARHRAGAGRPRGR